MVVNFIINNTLCSNNARVIKRTLLSTMKTSCPKTSQWQCTLHFVVQTSSKNGKRSHTFEGQCMVTASQEEYPRERHNAGHSKAGFTLSLDAIIPFKLSRIIGRPSIHTRKATARAFTAVVGGKNEFKKPAGEREREWKKERAERCGRKREGDYLSERTLTTVWFRLFSVSSLLFLPFSSRL